MPTRLRIGPYRFFFYSGEGVEPPHVHIRRERFTAKFWLQPVRLARSGGFASVELSQIQRLVEENQQQLLREWNDYFGQ